MLVVCWFLTFLGMAGWLPIGRRLPAVSAGRSAPQVGSRAYSGVDPNAVCAHCHQAIYERYRTTPMANASGPALEGFQPGSFTHKASGVSYRILEKDSRVYLAFARGAAEGESGSALKGQRELKYFIGSGKRGRTYLFDQDGYWFEVPVNWYGKKRIWDMAPNYLNTKEMPLTMPVDPGCLRCHSSEAQPSLLEARNRYAAEPFLEGGITCTACHGDPAAHLASGGHVAMANLDELPAVRRDSICLSCHLEGQEAVVHQGKRLVDFRPGQNIFDYASYFVRESAAGERATSQWEALLQSGCKRASGKRLTCTTCHDPHGSTAAMGTQERIEFYRMKCLQCHDPEAAGVAKARTDAGGQIGFAARHHPEDKDCASCHMPQVKADDIAHEQVTDHRIPRLMRATKNKTPQDQPSIEKELAVSANARETLTAIGSAVGVAGESSSRDLGLAYALAATRGDRVAGARAMQLLAEASTLPGAASDGELHEQLGFLDQLAGEKDAAAQEYGQALAADPYNSIAAGNLALVKAEERQYGEAIELWQRAFEEDPAQLKAGMNLAIVECGLGRKEAALGTLDQIFEFSPDDGEARELASGIRSGKRACGGR
jgi:predicted CXXCH cytochrome family protein